MTRFGGVIQVAAGCYFALGAGSAVGVKADVADLGYELLFEDALDEFEERCIKEMGRTPKWATGDFIVPSLAQFSMGGKEFVGYLDPFGKMNRFSYNGTHVCATYKIMDTGFYNESKKKGTIGPGLLFRETVPPRHCPVYNPLCNLIGAPNDNTFVNTFQLGDELISLTDSPVLLSVDPKTLHVVGKKQFDDKINGQVPVAGSAHILQNPATGEWIDFVGNGDVKHQGGQLRVYKLSADDPTRRQKISDHDVDAMPYIHSFGLTEKHMVIPRQPVMMDFNLMGLIKDAEFSNLLKDINMTKDGEDNSFMVIPLDGSKAKVRYLPFQEKLYYVHTVNCFENATGIVIDVTSYKKNVLTSEASNIAFQKDKNKRDTLTPRPVVKRYLLPHDETKAITSQTLSEVGKKTDFTKINPRFQGRNYCYYWSVEWFHDLVTHGAMAIVKYDLCHGHAKKFWYRKNWFPSEALMIPRPGENLAEDDGVMMFTALDGANNQTFLVVVNAATMEEVSSSGPFPKVPFTTHAQFYPTGSFVSSRDAPQMKNTVTFV
eukprot:TRINITY_DN15984_c0_g1_i1.p1 TRINITY_DN15984_c0_g1~~TRINITY_DN15984_c0_g1_i1.p1  ORF type:complete len:545 (+),score=68.55 TRINITY_DN15984_c0_g1_i1:131-1765(+)